jgi:hypothetical protein
MFSLFKKFTKIKSPFILLIGFVSFMLVFESCKKEEPEVVDPNLSKYVVEKVKVLTTKGEDLNAQSTITKVNEAEYTVDAIVPDDGNDGKRFKVEFQYPSGITPVSVTPSVTDSIDFSVAKTFTIKFTEAASRKYTVNIIEQAPQAPVITAFTITGAQQTVIEEDIRRISVRVPQGTNLTAITPKITLTPSTAIIVGGEKALDFTNPQAITVKNGGSSKTYSVKVEDYGFTKITKLMDRSLASSMRPGIFATKSETSIALDSKGEFAFVSYGDGIKKYNLATPSAEPTDLKTTYADGKNASFKILQNVGTVLLGCNNPWQAGDVVVSAWPSTGPGDSPVEVARIPIPTGGIIQNFHVKLEGANIIAYFVDRAPLRKSPKEDPVMYSVTIPLASVLAGQKVTAFTSNQKMNGLVTSGVGDGPNIELLPIPNSNEFFYNSGTSTPTILNSSFSSPAAFSGALVNGSSVGMKAFEHNRGKYIMWGVFSWSTNAANPKASKFVLLDVTKRGYRSSITEINSDLANSKFTLWNDVQKIDVGLGGISGELGDFYCQTAFATTTGGKLRLACLSAQNGFVIYEVE